MVLASLMQRMVHCAFRAGKRELSERPPMRETAAVAATPQKEGEEEEKEDQLDNHSQSVKCHPSERAQHRLKVETLRKR